MTETKYDENRALKLAVEVAIDSPCQSKRGVIIWNRKTGNFVTGYNSPPFPFKCNGSDSCKKNCAKTAVHAEQRAIINLIAETNEDVEEMEMLHVKAVGGEAVPSEKPSCWQCSKLILEAGIKYMWLLEKDGLVRYSAKDFHQKTLENNSLN